MSLGDIVDHAYLRGAPNRSSTPRHRRSTARTYEAFTSAGGVALRRSGGANDGMMRLHANTGAEFCVRANGIMKGLGNTRTRLRARISWTATPRSPTSTTVRVANRDGRHAGPRRPGHVRARHHQSGLAHLPLGRASRTSRCSAANWSPVIASGEWRLARDSRQRCRAAATVHTATAISPPEP